MGLLPSYPIVDLPSKFIHQVRVRVSRNLRPFPFIPIMKREDLTEIQRTVRRLFASDHYEVTHNALSSLCFHCAPAKHNTQSSIINYKLVKLTIRLNSPH